ncbi:MAG: hypothetical protein LBQ31_06445 [Bacteroidales bacterium]|jgi:cell division protein FtsQ|nr:hypothetical protein [Bacteroidales bacterium]
MIDKIKYIWRIIRLPLLTAIVVAGGIFAVVKTQQKQNLLKINSVNITVSRGGDIVYLQKHDIENYLYGDHKVSLDSGKEINEVNIHYVENLLRENPYVRHAEVYVSQDGIIYLDIEQRQPVLKVYNKNNEVFNIDKDGIIMPNNPKYPAYIRVANGNISAKYHDGDTAKNILHSIFMLSRNISADTVMDALIEQIYVNEKNNIILIPKVGDVAIIFGKATNMKEKIKKIKDFYTAIPSFNSERRYKVLDARFRDQIVGIKKEN